MAELTDRQVEVLAAVIERGPIRVEDWEFPDNLWLLENQYGTEIVVQGMLGFMAATAKSLVIYLAHFNATTVAEAKALRISGKIAAAKVEIKEAIESEEDTGVPQAIKRKRGRPRKTQE